MSKLEEGTKFTILMDVDGVLNDFHEPSNPTYTTFEAENGFQIAYDETILERIVNLHTKGVAEVKWLTTWCHDANNMLRETFGFAEDLEVVGYSLWKKPLSWDRWWKLDATYKYGLQHPAEFIIWIDDELKHHTQAMDFVHNDPRMLAISPYPSLNHNDLDTLEEWIETNAHV